MKWLVILLILLAVILYLVYRYRKHLQTAWFMYRTVKRMRQNAKQGQKQVPERDTSRDTELVMCPKCGKWAAKDSAVKLKSDFFCSHACMEEALAAQRAAR